MGFFDESSSDDEERVQQQHAAGVASEEEDPLDAYMKSLQEQQQQEATLSNEHQQPTSERNTRFDLVEHEEEEFDDEEEDHTTVAAAKAHSMISSQDHEEFQSSQLLAATNAKKELERTFRKAGCSDISGKDQSASGCALPPPQHSLLPVSTTPFSKSFWEGRDTAVGKHWRRDQQVTLCSSNSNSGNASRHGKKGIGNSSSNTTGAMTTMDPILQFAELKDVFGVALMQQITAHYTAPTPVQSQTLSVALAGRDAVVTASTGQGKTLAYIWPIAVHVAHQTPLQPGETGPIALVLVPTRELALQVQKQAKPMLAVAADSGKPLTCRAVIGGQGKYVLRQELKKAGVEVVIATPGRLLDVASDRKGLSLQRVTFAVLDEADKMLQMGFEQQVRQILQQIRPDRQTLMLSATMGLRVEKVASEWLQADAVRISVGRTGEASQNVEQHVMVLPNEAAKETFLMEMLPVFSEVGRTVVFVATRDGCERLAALVRMRAADGADVPVLTLHGDKHQSDRTAAVRAFTKGEVKILIATDVAARGLDIPNIQTVLSFDHAKCLDSHVHRVGRAGRLSKDTNEQQSGSAYTLLTPKNADFAHILRSAFVREGRIVSPQLEELAQKSRRAGTVERRTKDSKAGLGFVEQEGLEASLQAASTAKYESAIGDAAGYYGPSGDTHAPPAKRGRWS